MPPIFFLLSGEHKTLPFAELEAILEAEGIAYREIQRLPQVLRLQTDITATEAVKRRAALTRTCCHELFCCQAFLDTITKNMQSVQLDSLLQPGESFVVRVRRVGKSARNLIGMNVERKLGELILSKVKGVKVNLRLPKKNFFGVITASSFVFGLKLAEISPTPFMQRRPRKRAFFHPSAMPAKLARCMVNLARSKSGELILDPFCGTGSFLIEASLLGCRVLGCDIKKHMLKGSMQNLKFLDLEYDGLIVADAKHLPMMKVDCIVTDPPYGRSASTMGYTTKQIIQDFLNMSTDRIAKKNYICIAAPKTVNIVDIVKPLGLKHVQSHLVYVHRSLTREIVVLEKA
ncbi:MAG: N-6 DNA methylase [Candidatus Bathyarchaeota archaeon]|nr:MAG: N-6 DNA methylase [Candidatus Bathyarchaeota archaeon]